LYKLKHGVVKSFVPTQRALVETFVRPLDSPPKIPADSHWTGTRFHLQRFGNVHFSACDLGGA
jgi:hypothetical protein